MKKKGLSLKRELTVKESIDRELLLSGIPNIHDLKLKPVKRDVKNISNSVNNTILKKAGNKIKGLTNSRYLRVENVRNLKKVYGDQGNDYESIKKTLEGSLKNYVSYDDRNFITGELVDLNGERTEFVTIVTKDGKAEFKTQGQYKIRGVKNFSKLFISYSNLKGLMYLFKAVGEFFEKDENIDKFIMYQYYLFKTDNRAQLAINECDYDEIKELSKEYKSLEGVFTDEGVQDGKYITSDFIRFTEVEDPGFGLLRILNGSSIVFRDPFLRYVGGGSALLHFYRESVFLSAYDLIVMKNMEEEKRSKELHASSKNYARSFETKMNIPEYIQERMKESEFLSHFGYVEFDELVDVEKIDELERDWDELRKIVKFPEAKGQSLRFRRLGHYKASGVYFPYQESLCVDINTTSSFVHEYFHLIDFSCKKNDLRLSAMFEFIPIINRYKDVVEKKRNEPEYASFNEGLSGKYNIDYYFSEEEIFARCGEMYLRNVNSHLLGDKIGKSPVYPEDEILFNLIDDYFDNLDIIKVK